VGKPSILTHSYNIESLVSYSIHVNISRRWLVEIISMLTIHDNTWQYMTIHDNDKTWQYWPFCMVNVPRVDDFWWVSHGKPPFLVGSLLCSAPDQLSLHAEQGLWPDSQRKTSCGGTPIAGWFTMKNPSKMDDLGIYHYFRKPPSLMSFSTRGGVHQNSLPVSACVCFCWFTLW